MVYALNPVTEWQPVTWHDEKAFASISHGWKAVVSLERGRLMHFGPADREINLLLAPPNRNNADVWGGHRVWLGPQSAWSKIWPPPPQWELSGPESYATEAGVLRLVMADPGEGWPHLTRVYEWDGAKLICRVEMSGGTRQAQIIQIFQVPAATVVLVRAYAVNGFPVGYVRLPSMVSRFSAEFPQPAQVTRTGDDLTLRHTCAIEKLGFLPQPIIGQSAGGFNLTVSRGAQSGTAIAGPDQGLFTQVYLGGHEPLIELEQLSPLFAAGAPASFAAVLEGIAR